MLAEHELVESQNLDRRLCDESLLATGAVVEAAHAAGGVDAKRGRTVLGSDGGRNDDHLRFQAVESDGVPQPLEIVGKRLEGEDPSTPADGARQQ
jgi:hypothetical protein